MANVVRDPKEHPEAVLGDFAHANPIVTFGLDQVAFVYGSRWKQRYFTKRGDDYYPLPAQWDIQKSRWLPYHVEAGTDWWVPFYGPTNLDRPTGPTCDGCHSVNYNTETKQVTEWNVGCEKCHGPGSLHPEHPTKQSDIVNPGTLDYVRGNDVCIQCHSQGRPLGNPISGKYYDWPVGYMPGQRLAEICKLGRPDSGHDEFLPVCRYAGAQKPDAGKRLCAKQHVPPRNPLFQLPRCTQQPEQRLAKRQHQGICLSCHTKDNPAGLKGTVSAHTHHAENSAGSQCIACHMPKIEQTIKDNFVHAHTFRFISPGETARSGIPNPCTSCHADKSNEWATASLKSWGSVSPWRVAQ